MAIGNPHDRDYFVIGGAVKLTGGSLNLSKGELALVDQKASTVDGLSVLSTLAGKSKRDKDLVLRLGVSERDATRSHGNGSQKTLPFSLDEVIDLKVSAPENTEQLIDEVILGYDGINPDTAFDFRTGDAVFRVTLELKGDALAYRGGGESDCEYVSVNVDIPDCNDTDDCESCDPCASIDPKEIIEETIERLKNRQVVGGNTVSQFVDITPVFRCDNPRTATEIPYDYYCVSVCDSGTEQALALVAQQYDTAVIRTERVDATSTYQMLLPQTAGAPADYDQTIASLIKGCEDCPAGYTASPEGILYTISMEDDGTDQVALVEALPGYVATTSNREDGGAAGVGFYTAVMDNELTAAEITSFLGTNAITSTAIIESFGVVAAICADATVTSTAWANCGTCNAIEETYTITLADDTCGNDKLVELNGAYENTVTIATYASTSIDITLTGTSGTANVTLEGVDYLSTFLTDLTTTADNFVTAHAAAILATSNSVVTAAAGVLTFETPDEDYELPSIANVTTDLDGTVSGTTATTMPAQDACQTKYTMSVISNLVCDECDPVFEDFYRTEAPEAYDFQVWEKDANVGSNPEGTCLTGIRIKGKAFSLESEESLRDTVGFIEASTMVRASAGYPIEVREGIGRIKQGQYQAKHISRWVPRTHLAGNLRDLENEGRSYFRGYDYKDYLGRLLTGEISNMEDQLKQYVMYTLQIRSGKGAQGFGGRVSQDINYHVWVEVGRHGAVETLLNDIATHAGVPAVRAFGA